MPNQSVPLQPLGLRNHDVIKTSGPTSVNELQRKQLSELNGHQELKGKQKVTPLHDQHQLSQERENVFPLIPHDYFNVPSATTPIFK